MKNKVLLCALLALLFVSCKHDADLYDGDYSYKTSGTVKVSLGDGSAMDVSLDDVIGQMYIEMLHSGKNDSVLIIMNEFGGEVNVIKAKVEGDSLTIVPYAKTFGMHVLNAGFEASVQVYGTGNIYGDSKVILRETYSGTVSSTSSLSQQSGTIDGEGIVTVAIRNN